MAARHGDRLSVRRAARRRRRDSDVPVYAIEKKLAKNPEEFGKGAIEGVAGPEAANNAAAAGALVPLLTLGMPTTATAAIMLAAFQQYGIQPGPLLFETQPQLVWGLIASLYIGNVMLLVLNLPLVACGCGCCDSAAVALRRHPHFRQLGAYAANNSWFDLWLLLIIGVLGFLMRRYGIPVAPAIIGMILGPVAEEQMRRALQISDGELSGLYNTAFSQIVYVIIALLLVGPPIARLVRNRRGGKGTGSGPDAGRDALAGAHAHANAEGV